MAKPIKDLLKIVGHFRQDAAGTLQDSFVCTKPPVARSPPNAALQFVKTQSADRHPVLEDLCNNGPECLRIPPEFGLDNDKVTIIREEQVVDFAVRPAEIYRYLAPSEQTPFTPG